MNWHALQTLLGGRTLFETSMLLSGPDPPPEVHRQLSRWTASGRLIQLRRGLYAIAPPFGRTPPSALAVAARIRKPSYVSLQSALAYHGATPESTPGVTTSVTTGRPGRFETPLGGFLYRHLRPDFFWGYDEVEAGRDERAYVALPEKALLDLFHLTPGVIGSPFVRELRLAPGQIDSQRLRQFAKRAARPKLTRAAALTARIIDEEMKEEKVL